mmetsp:Transcript_9789/g.26126  ORF Transcript_9789/g.26126 Transcript_9789/m.26126 type:complete len:269 (+) Transcript_9789:84-890(+)
MMQKALPKMFAGAGKGWVPLLRARRPLTSASHGTLLLRRFHLRLRLLRFRLCCRVRSSLRGRAGRAARRGLQRQRAGLAPRVVGADSSRPSLRLGRRHVGARDVVLGAGARHPRAHDLAAVLLNVQLDVDEAGTLQHSSDLIVIGGPSNSAGEALERLERLWDIRRAEHVGDGDAAAGPEHAVHLLVHLRLVRREVDDAVGYDAIRSRVADGQVLDLAQAEGHVADPVAGGGGARLRQHLRRHVDADEMAGRPDDLARDEAVHAGAAA